MIANKMIEVLSFFSLYCRSLTWERDDGIVLIGSWFGEKFADNSRYLYQYLFDNKEKLGLKKVVWVTRKESICKELVAMGYECYMMDSKESIYYHKHAGWHIVCNNPTSNRYFYGDIEGKYSYGAKRVNLWHGVGLKAVGYSSNEYILLKQKHPVKFALKRLIKKLYLEKFINGSWVKFYMLCSSKDNKNIVRNYFGLTDRYHIISSYPRNCKPLRLLANEKRIIGLINQYKYSVMYLPTFRTGDDHFSFTDFKEVLKQTLEDNRILLIQKAHSADTQNSIKDGLEGNVLNLPTEFDINVLLPYISVLITDYSSVMSDAMFHKKPVLYLVPDYDDYAKGDRGFVINPDEIMKGPRFDNINDLNKKLAYYCKYPDEAKLEGYYNAREKLWGKGNKNIGEIWQDIKNHILM